MTAPRPSLSLNWVRKPEWGCEEQWKPCPDYEDLYEISDQGRCASLHFGRRKILKLASAVGGYPTVGLYRDGKRITRGVHRLVCRAFHGEPVGERNEAAHLNGDPSDPRAVNLTWATKVENMGHKRLHGTHQEGDSHHMVQRQVCPKGHEYSGANLFIRKNGYRECRECMRQSTREWRARVAAARRPNGATA